MDEPREVGMILNFMFSFDKARAWPEFLANHISGCVFEGVSG